MASKKSIPWIPTGKEIEERMKEVKMTQGELSLITGISQPMISAIINEKKNTCSKNMVKIIDALWK